MNHLDDFSAVLQAIAERAAAHDADGSFPFEAFDELWKFGVLNLTIPADVGGSGAGLEAATEAVVAVGEADPSVALLLAQHLMLHNNIRVGSWPTAVKQFVQRSSIEGVALINALRVERDLGTPARGGLPATVAARLPDGRGWRLTGRKIYSTGIPILRWLLVWARTDDPDPSVGYFVVDATTPGISVERTWDSLGMRATRSDDVIFDGVEIPIEHGVEISRVAAASTGIDPVYAAWNAILMAAVYHGVARAARDWLAGYLNERIPSNLGAPLASLPRVQEAFGRIEALVSSGDRLLRTTAAEIDADAEATAAALTANLVKLTVTNNAITAVLEAVRLVGNPGLFRSHPLERHLRNVLHGPVHTPQDDSILVAAGRVALQART
jgi:alkylation response protein AidB-like acyl-CoA dehydrogenase